MTVHWLNATNYLSLGQSMVEAAPRPVDAISYLDLYNITNNNWVLIEMSNELLLENVFIANQIITRDLSNNLGLSNNISQSFDGNATTALGLDCSIDRLENVINTLNLSNATTIEKFISSLNDLALSINTIANIVIIRGVTLGLGFDTIALAYVNDNCLDDVQVVGHNLNITFNKQTTFYMESDTESITLRSPEYGDTYTVSQWLIQNKSTGGDILSYVNQNDDEKVIYDLTFLDFNLNHVNVVEEFINNNFGKEITVTTNDGLNLTAVILNTSQFITQLGISKWQLKIQLLVWSE